MEGKERPHKGGGSRYLYEPFQSGVELAPMLKLEALERVQAERWTALDYRLGHIEARLERLEKRVWLTIFGVAAAVLKETVTGVFLP
ncbi:GTA head formation protein, RCAP_rcc01685 family [Litoreibacter albidus]|uniref:GTA head formation protein, RCAP_rcc01685 family n=1 Tax=Litoreibacter albidus TaxID=670155 RepID=UPI003735316F